MAQRQRKQVQSAVYGSLAYDLDTLARERTLEEAGQVERQRHRESELVRRQQAQTAVQPRVRVSPVVLGSVVVLAVMMVVLLMCYVRLTEISNSVSEIKEEVGRLNEENVSLLTTYEKTFDMTGVKEMAEAAGMGKPSAGQIEYIEMGGSDTAVIYEADSEGLLDKLFGTLEQGALSVMEYFR